MDLSKKKVKKKQKNKKTGDTRTIVKTVESDSLFNLLGTDREAPKKEDDPDSAEEELAMKVEDLQNFMEDVNDIALPDCLEYYLNLHEDDMPDMDDEDDDDDDDDDEDGDDDDKKKRKKSGVSAKSGKSDADEKPKGGKKGGKKSGKKEDRKSVV